MSESAALACPSCGEPTGAGDRFCEACGHELLPGVSVDGAVEAGEGPAPADASRVPEAPVVATVRGVQATQAGGELTTCPACDSPAQWLDGYCGVCGTRQPAARDHMELTLPGLAAVTDRGRRHHRNEDAFAAAIATGFLAVVVCDGVSTTVKPDEASQAAADAALAVLIAGDGSPPHLERAYDAARAAVLAVPFEPHPELGPPSCTFLAATLLTAGLRVPNAESGLRGPNAESGLRGPNAESGLRGPRAVTAVNLATSGDCRSYWLGGDGSVSILTVDDSWAQAQLAAGRPAEEVWGDPRAHSITRWLAADADPTWRPTLSRFEPPEPGRLLLCSDGLWNYTLEESHLAVLVKEAGDTDILDLARRLTQFANDAGGADNITVVLVDVDVHVDADVDVHVDADGPGPAPDPVPNPRPAPGATPEGP